MTILLVDSDPLIHQLYGAYLTHAGFRVLNAVKGLEALELALAQEPQVVVMDINLPDVSGMSLLREFRQQPGTNTTPVVVTAGIAEYRMCGQEAKALGAAAFLAKPFSPAQLLAEIQRVVADHPDAAAG
jgi:DNA-binding response OmpR family regulator